MENDTMENVATVADMAAAVAAGLFAIKPQWVGPPYLAAAVVDAAAAIASAAAADDPDAGVAYEVAQEVAALIGAGAGAAAGMALANGIIALTPVVLPAVTVMAITAVSVYVMSYLFAEGAKFMMPRTCSGVFARFRSPSFWKAAPFVHSWWHIARAVRQYSARPSRRKPVLLETLQ